MTKRTEKKHNISADKYSCQHNICSEKLTLLYTIIINSLNIKRTSSTIFYKRLPSSLLFLVKPNCLLHIATNLFSAQATTLSKQTNLLQAHRFFLIFLKPLLAIQKQSALIFAKRQAKINKLNAKPLNKCHALQNFTPVPLVT